MNKFQFFWDTMELCDWSHEGDDSQVLRPVIRYLAQQEDDRIFQFDDLMSELLYGLDTVAGLGSEAQKAGGGLSPYRSPEL